jgi:hypothetical protein
MAKVAVYRYMYWDDASNGRKYSSVYATLEAIQGLGTPAYATRMEVDRLSLRDDGIYVPEEGQEEAAEQTPSPESLSDS